MILTVNIGNTHITVGGKRIVNVEQIRDYPSYS